MRPYASCAAHWRCNRTTQMPFCTLDSRWSPTIDPGMQSPSWRRPISVSNGSPAVTGVLIRAYAHAGRRSDALRLLAELQKRRKAGYVPAGAFVNAYLGLGENDQAFAWLEQAYKEQSNILQFLKVHPYFDPIRGRSSIRGPGPPRRAGLRCQRL